MNWNLWTRQFHRWVSIAFTAIVAAIFAMLGMGREPAQWVYYLPLLPLFLLTVTGLYLFALPYIVRRRKGVQE
jgi:ABC-type polysaccharide/polyol phosphate export permease